LQIQTLIADIQRVLRTKGWVTETLAEEFGRTVGSSLKEQFAPRDAKPTLRLSRMGPQCPCALWHSIHHPELAEELPPWAEFKYSFGHIIEAQAIMLAKAAQHEVTGEQDELVVDGITGHRDCVIDGCVVDVKSTSSMGFKKFKDGSIGQSDTFGYLEQLDGYLVGSANDPLVRTKDRAYLLAIDKQLGHMCLYEHRIREALIRERIKEYKQIIDADRPPTCLCKTVPDGKSGNIRLDLKASYSPFKHSCFPTLRTFLYATGPVYLTKVIRRPDVIEVDRYGKVIYGP
jgi:hypothetical protein